MIKKETIIADWVFQEFANIPYQWSLLISVPYNNTQSVFISENKNPLDSETFEIWPGQNISIEWNASRKENNYFISWKSWEFYQIITV